MRPQTKINKSNYLDHIGLHNEPCQPVKTENPISEIPTRMLIPGFNWLPNKKQSAAASHWVGVAEEKSSNQSIIGGCS